MKPGWVETYPSTLGHQGQPGRHKYYAKDDTWVSYGETQERMTQPVQEIVPDTERYWSPEAETASVYPLRDHDYHDPIMCMLCSALEESREDDPDDSIVTRMRLNISPPEEYSGSSDLEVYDVVITTKHLNPIQKIIKNN